MNQDLNTINDQEIFKPMTFNDVGAVLDLTIKKDYLNKIITFACMLNVYTSDSQFNISFNAPSSSGKTYIPLEVAKLFPKSDVLEVGYCTPTAFFHDLGKSGKDKSYLTVDLSRKILIFLDQPNNLLLERLRPMLSHDKRKINHKITDRQERKGIRTKNVVMKGYPSVVFCTASYNIDEQEATRFFLLSPEIDEEKIKAGVRAKFIKGSNRNEYRAYLAGSGARFSLKKRIQLIKHERIKNIIIPFQDKLLRSFTANIRKYKPRHQRDVDKLLNLVKAHTLLNCMHRENIDNNLIATIEDAEAGLQIWASLAPLFDRDLPPYINNVYFNVILPAWKEKNPGVPVIDGKPGLTRRELMKRYYEHYGQVIPDWQLRNEILPLLETAGLIIQEKQGLQMLTCPLVDEIETTDLSELLHDD